MSVVNAELAEDAYPGRKQAAASQQAGQRERSEGGGDLAGSAGEWIGAGFGPEHGVGHPDDVAGDGASFNVIWKYPGWTDTYREGTRSLLGRESRVPKVPPYPVEFRQRAVELARMREKPVAELASDLGVSETCLRNWVAQADRDEGRRSDGLTSAEREELVRLRRELRVAKLEVEILKRAAAYFAQENVLPK